MDTDEKNPWVIQGIQLTEILLDEICTVDPKKVRGTKRGRFLFQRHHVDPDPLPEETTARFHVYTVRHSVPLRSLAQMEVGSTANHMRDSVIAWFRDGFMQIPDSFGVWLTAVRVRFQAHEVTLEAAVLPDKFVPHGEVWPAHKDWAQFLKGGRDYVYVPGDVHAIRVMACTEARLRRKYGD